MGTDDDWRAQREAALAGTPFARPRGATGGDIDATLPIPKPKPTISGQPVGTPKAAAALPPKPAPPRQGANAPRWLPLLLGAAIGVVLLAVALWWVNRSPAVDTAVPVTSPPAAVTAPPAAPPPSSSPTVTAEPPVVAPTVDTPPPPALNAVPVPQSTPVARVVDTSGKRLKRDDRPRPAKATTARAPEQRKATTTKKTADRDNVKPATAMPLLPPIKLSGVRCAPNSSRAELAICASPALTAKAREEHRLYSEVIANGDARSAAKAQRGQASLIKRRDRCKNNACIDRAYTRQIATLQKMQQKATKARARAAEKLLPVCAKSQRPAAGICRSGFSVKRLLGL